MTTNRTDPHAELVRFWCDRYHEKVGAKYPFAGGKDGKTIKDLRAMYSDSDLRTYMAAFFEIQDDWLEEQGHSLPLFRGMLPKVIAFVKRQQQPTPSVSKAVVEPMRAWLAQKKAAHE